MSTLIPNTQVPRHTIEEIIHHPQAFQVPPVDIVVAPGQQVTNQAVNRGIQRVQGVHGMAARHGQNLQGADPALVQILTLKNNRDANRDNAQKKFLMFPKEVFTGQDKKLSQGHWSEFAKYLDYQSGQGIIQRNNAHIDDIKSVFRLTLQDIALGWFDSKGPNLRTEDALKQAFLKWFNLWGDTRHQQQDTWNKLKFNMSKDDVDAFVVNMKMLASILGHNDEAIKEKFRDIFPEKNIEAALVAMDDFAAMQAKAKQLVMIYKPTQDSAAASASLLVHTAMPANTQKGAQNQDQSNQHQLAPIQNPSEQHGGNNSSGTGRGQGQNRGRGGPPGHNNNNNRYDNANRGGGRGTPRQF